MKSPTCTILSRPAAGNGRRGVAVRAAVGAVYGCALGIAALLQACGGSAPAPERQQAPGMPPIQDDKAMEKGQGSLNFHYANKSTEAHMDLDLGATDVYLEMSGQRVTDPEAESGKSRPSFARAGAPESRPMTPDASAGPQPPESHSPQAANARPDAGDPANRSGQRPKAERPPEPLPEADQGSNEDVTGKVLSGIRRAQELFYQKRFPEALQMVRQSLDAQPTAEGHALAGSIHYMMGQNGLARRNWQEALRLNPDMPAVVNMLERTRTPGGRGSPAPRPVAYHPPAPAQALESGRPAEEAPFPEEYQGDNAAPGNDNGPPPRPASPRRQRPARAVPAPAAANAPAPAASDAAAPSSTSAENPEASPDGNDADAEAAQAPPAPAVTPAVAPAAPASAATSSKTAPAKPAAAKPSGNSRSAAKDSTAVKTAKPSPGK